MGARAARIAERWLAEKGFPELAETFKALGVRVEAGRVRLDDNAPLAAVRRGIMAPPKR